MKHALWWGRWWLHIYLAVFKSPLSPELGSSFFGVPWMFIKLECIATKGYFSAYQNSAFFFLLVNNIIKYILCTTISLHFHECRVNLSIWIDVVWELTCIGFVPKTVTALCKVPYSWLNHFWCISSTAIFQDWCDELCFCAPSGDPRKHLGAHLYFLITYRIRPLIVNI